MLFIYLHKYLFICLRKQLTNKREREKLSIKRKKYNYRSGTVNLDMVNSKFHLI